MKKINTDNRRWEEMGNDEIYAIWAQYIRTSYYVGSEVNFTYSGKKVRLTSRELHELIDELLNRLEIKENIEIEE